MIGNVQVVIIHARIGQLGARIDLSRYAFATLFLLYLSVKNDAGFWTIFGLSIFFAIVSRRMVKFHRSDGAEHVDD